MHSLAKMTDQSSDRKSRRPSAIVIGQGAAGLTAALTMARQGIDVTSISKVRPGNATCTIYAGGGFTLGIGGLSTEEHKEMTYRTGRKLSIPGLLDTFASEGPSIVDFMEGAGVPLTVRRGGLGVHRNPGFPLLGGKALTDALHKASLNLKVSFVHNTAAMRLLTNDSGVSGIECIDHSSGEVVQFQANAVVLATGGGGTLFERTDNPQRITGDGYRLALESKCHLLDMEFVQFYPIGIDIPGGAHWFLDLGIIDHARLTGADGREFLEEMLTKEGIESGRQANLLARDMCTVAIALESQKGPVLLHLEDIPQDAWQQDRYLGSIGRMFPKTTPAWSGPVTVHPIEHYFPGGVAIGTRGETEVPGLFACGEVTGGVDGANRVGGNALTNCLLFGRKAGEAAAAHAKGERVAPLDLSRLYDPSVNGARNSSSENHHTVLAPITVSLSLPPTRSASEWLYTWKKNADVDNTRPSDSTISPDVLRRSLREYSTAHLLPMRDDVTLRTGKEFLYQMREHLEKQVVRGSRDLLLATENLGLWHTAVAVTESAMVRTESRGAHFRTDYPTEDAGWQKHIYLFRAD